MMSSPASAGRGRGPIASAMGEERGQRMISFTTPKWFKNDRWPLSFPIASQWAPVLSPLTRGEDEKGSDLAELDAAALVPAVVGDDC